MRFSVSVCINSLSQDFKILFILIIKQITDGYNNIYISYALPLYLRALSLINPPESSCHSAVLMNNISEVFTGMGNLEEAQGWAERGLKLVENFNKKKKTRVCDESCGVLLFNLGMISEVFRILFS